MPRRGFSKKARRHNAKVRAAKQEEVARAKRESEKEQAEAFRVLEEGR